MKVFYARCSTAEQNEGRQLKYAEEIGAEKIYLDKASGSTTARPALKEMLAFVREGDTIYIESISRLARNVKDLLSIVDTLTAKKVALVSQKESIDTSTPQGRFLLSVWGAMAQLERESILQRQREGIALAKEQGKYKGRKPIAIDEKAFRRECAKWRAGEQTARATMRALGLKTNTFYKNVKELGV